MLEYGEKKVVRFSYDVEAQRLVVDVKEEVLDDGVVISYRDDRLVYRNEEFASAVEQFLPSASLGALELTAKNIVEQRKQEKLNQQRVKND